MAGTLIRSMPDRRVQRPRAALPPGERRAPRVLSVALDAMGWPQTLRTIETWAGRGESRTVCLCNAHSLVEAGRSTDFARALAGADLCLPDGAPVAWMLRRLGHRGQPRISGPDLMARYLQGAAARGEPIFLYGSRPATLERLSQRLLQRWPGLQIAGSHSPPFGEPSDGEDARAAQQIRASGARTVWVALGCPRQERWMARMRPRIPAVLLGVGAAFDFLAGEVRRAPPWMQRAGLEWLHRLAQEPRRLGRRYLVTQPLFAARALHEALRVQEPERRSRPQ